MDSLPREVLRLILSDCDTKVLAIRIPRVSKLFKILSEDNGDIWRAKCEQKESDANSKPSERTWKQHYFSLSIKLFPFFGATISKTTLYELLAMPGTKPVAEGVQYDGHYFHVRSGVFDKLYLTRIYHHDLCKEWIAQGISFDASWVQVKDLLKKKIGNYQVDEEPHEVEFSDVPCFTAVISAVNKEGEGADAIYYKLKFSFGFAEGTETTPKTLHIIQVKAHDTKHIFKSRYEGRKCLDNGTMDHNEIDLSVKLNNRRYFDGRYGVKTNKTVKKQLIDTIGSRRAPETISTLKVSNSAPLTRPNYYYSFLSAPVSLGVSLNKRKNWESVKNLKKSAYDINLDYRVVEIDNYCPKSGTNRRVVGDLKMRLYKLDKVAPKDEKRDEIQSGVNRKGYFVREKRRKGKKGVKSYYNNSNEYYGDLKANSSESSSYESNTKNRFAVEGGNSDSCTIYIVQKRIKNPATIRGGPFYGCACKRTCTCNKDLVRTRRRRDLAQQIKAMNINVLN